MQQLQISLLGPLEIRLDGAPVETERRKALALLAYLAVENAPQTREALAALFWPDYPRQSAFAYLRRTLWELNQMLGPGWLEAGRERVTLVRQPGLWLDAAEFVSLLASPAGLARAVELYRGDFMAQFILADTAPFETWQRQQAEYLRRLLADGLEKLVVLTEQEGAYSQALAYALRWQDLDLLNEAACRAGMRQYANLGERSGAARLYQNLAQVLQHELGVTPQPETTALYQAVLRGDQQTAQTEKALTANPLAQPLVKPSQLVSQLDSFAPAAHLPDPLTPFIGRRLELDQIRALLLEPANRLVTLLGPGGAGKTRLSIQAAQELAAPQSAETQSGAPMLAEIVRDGVWFVELAALSSPEAIVTAAAKALSICFFIEEDSPRQQLLDYLRDKRLLLVLDNMEHLLPGGAALAAEILSAAPGVRLLVTSRQRLNLQAEQIFRVAGMRVPDPNAAAAWDNPEEQARPYSSVQLWVERARRVQPDFRLTQANLAAVIAICRLVDGSPLGIELAAAWLALLSPAEIAAEIGRSLDFLETSAPDTPLRQRSLRAVFEYSWNLLSAQEQQAFQRLCVFQGSFSRQAAQFVGEVSLGTLLGLANKSWLQQAVNGRYQLHELLRQFGAERLQADPAEARQARDRHAEFFAAFASQQGLAMRTSGQVQALDALGTEFMGNLQAAWGWLAACGRLDVMVTQMLPALFQYWIVRSDMDTMLAMLKQARQPVSAAGDRQSLLQWAILEAVETSFQIGWTVLEDQPKERMQAVWKLVVDERLEEEMGIWYLLLVSAQRESLPAERLDQIFRDLLARAAAAADDWDAGYLYFIAGILKMAEEPGLCQQSLEKALTIFERMEVVDEQGLVLEALGSLEARNLNYAQAIQYNQAARRFFVQAGDVMNVCSVLIDLADYYIYLGKLNLGFETYADLKGFLEKTGSRRLYGQVLSWESMALARYGSLEDALRTRRMSIEIAQEVGSQNDIAWHTWELGDIHRLLGDLEQAQRHYQAARPVFEKLHEFNGLGFYHRALGEIAFARRDWDEALRQFNLALEFHERELRSIKGWGQIYAQALLGMTLIRLERFGEAQENLKAALNLAQKRDYYNLKALPLVGFASLLLADGQPARALEMAVCIASHPTTWNEVKQQAREIQAQAASQLPEAEASQACQRGDAQRLEGLVQQFANE